MSGRRVPPAAAYPATMAHSRTPIAFVGGGNMASAIIEGATRAGVMGDAWVVAEPDASKRAGFARAVPSARDAIRWLRDHEPAPGAGQILLAVKPQAIDAVAREVGPELRADEPERVVVSILAGTPSAKIRALLGAGRIVRVMPNTPAQIGRGVSAIAPGAGAGEADLARATELFEAVGAVVPVEEPLMDAFTALAGSGPAYVFFLAEAMVDAGVAVGFDRAQALAIVRETLAGSALLLANAAREPRALREAVTSRKGTTEAATDVLDARGVRDAVVAAIVAARDRGRALAE